MTVTLAERSADLAALRQRWYREGFFGDRTFGTEIERAAKDFPELGFVFASETEQRRVNFPEVYELARAAAGGLQRLGVGPGDIVAVQVPNRLELVVSYYAIFLTGAAVLPITHIYGPSEVSFILRQSGARVLIVPDRWRSIDYAERLGQLCDVPALEHVVMLGGAAGAGVRLGDGRAVEGVGWQELTSGPDCEPVSVASDDVCTMIYTSGTTSSPKGVQHTHNSLLAQMRTVAPMLGLRPGECKLVPWPAGHVAGLIGICAGLVGGFDTVLMDRWDVELAIRLIERHRCAVTSGTPMHITALLDAAAASGRDTSSLRYMQVGAANVAPQLVRRADAAGLSIARAYGSTEHPTSASSDPGAPADKRAGTDGVPRYGDEIIIVDFTGEQLPIGQEGEIATRGPSQFIGYKDAELNVEAFLPGGWYLTGDVGRLDADGYLTVTDRRKDIIIRGGENIASKEVEDILATHPKVLEAAVVAEPDATYGERVAAFVLLQQGQTLELGEVIEHFTAAGVARQKTPERLYVASELPRTPSGKVQKFALRERLRERLREQARAADASTPQPHS